jgi:biopolymer transport protein ExbD
MAIASTQSTSSLHEINTTPLIDVLLVLLVMFIITIPVATHQTEWNVAKSDEISERVVDPLFNTVVVTADNRILWNGGDVTQGQLSALLQQSLQLPVEPELRFQPQADAGYDLAAQVTHRIKAAGVNRFGFVGNEKYAEFGKAAN